MTKKIRLLHPRDRHRALASRLLPELAREKAAAEISGAKFKRAGEFARAKAIIREAEAVDSKVSCDNRLCRKRIDLDKDRHGTMAPANVIEHNPTASGEGLHTWHHFNSTREDVALFGEFVFCVPCMEHLLDQLGEREVSDELEAAPKKKAAKAAKAKPARKR